MLNQEVFVQNDILNVDQSRSSIDITHANVLHENLVRNLHLQFQSEMCARTQILEQHAENCHSSRVNEAEQHVFATSDEHYRELHQ